MKRFLSLLLTLLVTAAPVAAQTTQTPQDVVKQIDVLVHKLDTMLGPVFADPATVQSALNAGGTVHLKPDTIYTGPFTLRAGTNLVGHGATIVGPSNIQALEISASNVMVSDVVVASTHVNRAIMIGHNDTSQSTLASVPDNITLTRVSVPTYRGKAAIEVNGSHVSLIDCVVADAYDPGGQDSKAVVILNTPGPVLVQGGSYSAGSEVILVGGDVMKIPGVVPSDITIRNTVLWRPLAWHTEIDPATGLRTKKYKVKNLLEFKTGHHLVAQWLTLDGSWADSQDGSAIVITPHSGGDIHDVLIEDVFVDHVGGCFQFMGQEYAGIPTPAPLSEVVVRRLTCTASKATFGGRGIFALLTGEPASITIEDTVGVIDGSSLFLYDPGKVLTGVDNVTTRPGGAMGSLTVTGGFYVAGAYSFMMAGVPNAGPTTRGAVPLTVTGNTFAGAASALKTNLPLNTFVDRATFDALLAAR